MTDTQTPRRINDRSASSDDASGGAMTPHPSKAVPTSNPWATGGATTSRQPTDASPPNKLATAGVGSHPTNDDSSPISLASDGAQLAGRHDCPGAHMVFAASDQPTERLPQVDTHRSHVVGSDAGQDPAAKGAAEPSHHSLLDPALALAADVLDDIERVRIANENRLRQLTRSTEDVDGEERGFGLTADHPDVARLVGIVAAMYCESSVAGGLGLTKPARIKGRPCCLEHDALKNLERHMRGHPLGAWTKAQRGMGDKQAGRLLAAIGDPYWNAAEDRPRRGPAELWQYAGHGDPARSRRRRGQRVEFSPAAKMRVNRIAEKVIQLGNPRYRAIYDQRRVAAAERTHTDICVRCGPSGKPAQPGSLWSKGHQHGDALRVVGKTILQDLWREAKRIHESTAEEANS